MIKEYQKYIAENRNLVYVSTFLVILLRLGFFISFSDYNEQSGGGTLWNIVAQLFENKYVSFLCSLFATIGISLQMAYLNGKYMLIRGKTSLPYVFTIFLLSTSPDLIFMSPLYLGIIAIMLCINVLFSSYHQPIASKQAFYIGFILALASLFIPSIFVYLIIFWIGFVIMRSFSLKVFLASLFGAIMIYWLVVIYFLYNFNLNELLTILVSEWDSINYFSFLQMKTYDIVVLSVYLVIMVIVIINGYVNEFKDKIQVRSSFSFLRLIFLLSVLMYFFLNLHLHVNLILAVAISGFILSHFFALAEKKWKIYFFMIIAVFYFVNVAYFLVI